MRLRSERGFTLLEILAIIVVLLLAAGAAALFSGAAKSSAIAEQNACVTQLNAVQSAMQAWAATVSTASPNGDMIACSTAKNLVEAYNPVCGDKIGTVPVPTCGP